MGMRIDIEPTFAFYKYNPKNIIYFKEVEKTRIFIHYYDVIIRNDTYPVTLENMIRQFTVSDIELIEYKYYDIDSPVGSTAMDSLYINPLAISGIDRHYGGSILHINQKEPHKYANNDLEYIFYSITRLFY
jgi:hypothetical protein